MVGVGGPRAGGLGTEPKPPESDSRRDELADRVSAFLSGFVKACRAGRVYASNNEMLAKLLDRSDQLLQRVFELTDELDLVIREDRLLFGGSVVHEERDRATGLPYLLYRNAFRRLTFVSGLERVELEGLISALNTDYGPQDLTGEDLLTTLWRLKLPHLRYVTIDTLTPIREQGDDTPRDDLDAIQADIDSIVAAIYQTNAHDDDIVAGVSIGRDDLRSLAEVRGEPPEELERLEHYTDRAIVDIPPGQLERARSEAATDDHDALTRRMLGVLLTLLFKERSGATSGSTLELLQQLYDALLLAGRFGDARSLVERLRSVVESGDEIAEMHIAQHLLRLFASESRVLPVLEAFNDAYRGVPPSELVSFLRALGPHVVETLLMGLDHLDAAAHRKVVCDLIVELGVPEIAMLERRAASSKWFVARDILDLARHHPLERITRLVRDSLDHPHPKVRAQALRALRDYGPGTADELVASRLDDADPEVRIVAARVAAARRCRPALARIEAMLEEPGFAERDPRELKVMLGAYATIGQGHVVRKLAGVLRPGLLDRFKNIELQIAAASALALIPSEAAQGHLRRSARSLSGRIREACKRALNQSKTRTMDFDEETLPTRSSAPTFDLPEEVERVGELEASQGMAQPMSDVQRMHRSGPALPSVDVPYHEPDRIPIGTGELESELSLPGEAPPPVPPSPPDRSSTPESSSAPERSSAWGASSAPEWDGPEVLDLPLDDASPHRPPTPAPEPSQLGFDEQAAELPFREAYERPAIEGGLEGALPSEQDDAASLMPARRVLTPPSTVPLAPSEDEESPEDDGVPAPADLAADLFLDEEG